MYTELTSKRGITQLSSSVEQLILSPSQCSVQKIRDKRVLYSGVGVIYGEYFWWESMKNHLSSAGYKVITIDVPLHPHPTTLFPTIVQSISYPKPPAAAESSDSSPFVIAIFVSGMTGGSANTLYTSHGSASIVDDIIKPFLPQSAPHLQHIPKLFFISAWGDPNAPPPHFPDDPDGNYYIAYHVTDGLSYMYKWAPHITDHLFIPGISVQEVIENSRAYLQKDRECLHYFTCLGNKQILRK